MLPISPLLGGYLLLIMDWKSQFFGLFIFSVAQWFAYLWLPETKPKDVTKTEDARKNDSMRSVFFDIFRAIKYPVAVTSGVIALLSSSISKSWLIMAPVVIIHHYQFSLQTFGNTLLLTNFLPAVISLFNAHYVRVWGCYCLIKVCIVAGLVAGIVIGVASSVFFNIALQIAGVCVLMFSVSMISANSMIGLMLSLNDDEKNIALLFLHFIHYVR